MALRILLKECILHMKFNKKNFKEQFCGLHFNRLLKHLMTNNNSNNNIRNIVNYNKLYWVKSILLSIGNYIDVITVHHFEEIFLTFTYCYERIEYCFSIEESWIGC